MYTIRDKQSNLVYVAPGCCLAHLDTHLLLLQLVLERAVVFSQQASNVDVFVAHSIVQGRVIKNIFSCWVRPSSQELFDKISKSLTCRHMQSGSFVFVGTVHLFT
jgi:hypothetical protein